MPLLTSETLRAYIVESRESNVKKLKFIRKDKDIFVEEASREHRLLFFFSEFSIPLNDAGFLLIVAGSDPSAYISGRSVSMNMEIDPAEREFTAVFIRALVEQLTNEDTILDVTATM